jgi:small-conductance mechanosensitive channel
MAFSEESAMKDVLVLSREWLWSGGIVVVAALLALLAHRILFGLAERITIRTRSKIDNALVRYGRRPARLALPLLAVFAALPTTPLPDRILGPLEHAVGLGLIAATAWIAVALTAILDEVVEERYAMDVRDNLSARRVHTQLHMLRRIIVSVIGIVALSIMLMTFPAIRRIGTSLLASAGVAGLVLGIAARQTLASFIAGVQVALTEPIRIDDVVIVEGEWGRIEEINLTYVVVRIWDLRRLVVPLSYFIEKPFQNWTRTTADLLGTVFLYTDYTVPVEEVRQELHRVLEASGIWDGKSWGLQVTDSSPQSMELRALMSAADSGTAWNLRCHVREKLIDFLQEKHPESLPRTRAEILRRPPDR